MCNNRRILNQYDRLVPRYSNPENWIRAYEANPLKHYRSEDGPFPEWFNTDRYRK